MSSFFNMHARIVGGAKARGDGEGPITVSELNARVERTLRDKFAMSMQVRGELSNFTQQRSSGHWYFTLKDDRAAVSCVMFSRDAKGVAFEPVPGMEILATATLGVYVPRGTYQLQVSRLEPLGEGALELAKRQLEAKLHAEGIFDADRKSQLPRYPLRVALVTSPQAAGYADMLKVLARTPWIGLNLLSVPVQGAAAAPAIAEAIGWLNRNGKRLGIEVAIVGRGGGSLEDLWSFNDERVVRAVAACAVPIITGIGHEIDTSLADLAADYHAHTPTEAASVITRPWTTLAQSLEVFPLRMRRAIRQLAVEGRRRLDAAARSSILRQPTRLITLRSQQLDEIESSLQLDWNTRHRAAHLRLLQLTPAIERAHPRLRIARQRDRLLAIDAALANRLQQRLATAHASLDSSDKLLVALSPDAVLRRGYSLTRLKRSGAVVRNADDAKPGDRIMTRTAAGTIESVVADAKQTELFDD